MDRREFLKLAGLAGLAVTTPTAFLSDAHAQEADAPYDGTLYLVVHAGGGWDPTSLCDPKGALDPEEEAPMNHYLADDIRSPSESSPIRWAPFADNDAFFERHYQKMTIINGLDTATNNHAVGPRYIHSGTLSEGYPAFAALVAGSHAKASPLSFITNGGYDITRGVVSRTRVGNINAIRKLALPNRIDDNIGYHTGDTFDRIRRFQRERAERLRNQQNLPRLRRALSTMTTVRSSDSTLQRLTEHLPNLGNYNTSLGQQAALAIGAWKAGLCVSANLTTGGFDTHGNHDVNQANAMRRLTNGLNEIWDIIEDNDAVDRIMVIVGSDFGRTPGYNAGNGKDHWSITSMILMGGGIPGNRVIGTTTHGHRPNPVNINTLAPDENGVILSPVHVQRALRKYAGIDAGELQAMFPLSGDDLNLLG